MYKTILVPMALDHGIGLTALKIARTLLAEGGRIIALHVYEAPSGSVAVYLDEETVRLAFESARTRLEERVVDQPEVSPVLLKGHTSRSIIDYASGNQIDCIVIGSHKPGLSDYLLGSTASRVVRHSPCAVHVLRNPN